MCFNKIILHFFNRDAPIVNKRKQNRSAMDKAIKK